jgi:hypothetical protein
MKQQGSCHCGKVTFEVEGEPTEVNECNCSYCSRKGFQLWFVPRGQFRLRSGEGELTTYLFNRRHIQHQFCKACGTQAFAFGEFPKGTPIAAVNVRCLPDVDRSKLKVKFVDGKSF